MPGRVHNKVAFITGAARGQGRSHAIRLAEEGSAIIALDIADDIRPASDYYPGATQDDLADTVAAVEAVGGRILARRADVRDFAQVQAVVEEGTALFGGIDIVSANAGIFIFGQQSHEISEEDWDAVLDVNLKGVWQTCKAVTPGMIERGRGGSIIITSSSAGLKGIPNVAPYTASKHAIGGLMKTLALELAEHRIRVNTVHPTTVATPMILNERCYRLFMPEEEHPTRDQVAPLFTATNALQVPWVEPRDISNAVLFLASDEAQYVTGTEFKVDAGFDLH